MLLLLPQGSDLMLLLLLLLLVLLLEEALLIAPLSELLVEFVQLVCRQVLALLHELTEDRLRLLLYLIQLRVTARRRLRRMIAVKWRACGRRLLRLRL